MDDFQSNEIIHVLNWHCPLLVANICLYVDLLCNSLWKVPIQHIDDFIALEIIHAVRPFTEVVHSFCNSDALLTLIKKCSVNIVLPFTAQSKHGGRSQVSFCGCVI
ncbi:hypothetical protein ACB092_04G184900 [Castanea dentata]